MNTLNLYGPLVGRILIALLFILAGVGKISGFEGTAGYIASKGLPFPELLTAGTIAVEIGGGLLLAIGWKARCAALSLFAFTALTAFIFHNFWSLPPAQAQEQMIHFMKNLSIMGGLLFVVTHGSGRLSLEKQRT